MPTLLLLLLMDLNVPEIEETVKYYNVNIYADDVILHSYKITNLKQCLNRICLLRKIST